MTYVSRVLLPVVTLLSLFVFGVFGAPEQGKFHAELSVKGYKGIVGFSKTLYSGSKVKLFILESECEPSDDTLTVKWLVRSSSCYGEQVALSENALFGIMNMPDHPYHYGSGYFIQNEEKMKCGKPLTFTNAPKQNWTAYPAESLTTMAVAVPVTPTTSSRRKRAEGSETGENGKKKEDKKTENVGPTTTNTPSTTNPPQDVHAIATTQHKAPYLLIVEVKGEQLKTKSLRILMKAEMKTPKGYLSAHEYPLLTFYMIMCILYSLYAVAWLVMSACNFRDLLRVQFWIGGVILLGMIEKAVFYSEYLSVNTTGESVTGASKFAEVVSAMKRALARMLVIIVSLGFGIVKPRLGPMLHRVIGIGILYFILAVIEALVRTDSPIRDPTSNNVLFASIPLAIIDSVICWWIFMSLMQTMKTLRLRRNVVKLSLYRHFSNTIIFCVIASLAMIFYSLRYRDECMTDWPELWVDTAFWHILFSIILLVIMILWRPNINNQRYAFSPLIDGNDDEESEEPMLGGSGATETVKMRGLRNASGSNHDPTSKAEEDLKWIEENIPQTVADAALPAIMDSDEEIMTTKYEMSKME